MRSFSDAKAMARTLRERLFERDIRLSHSDCLEIVARQFGFADWNVLSALIEAAREKQQPLPIAPGWFATGFTDRKRYRTGLDPDAPGVALIECIVGRDVDLGDSGFACLMQSIDASAYVGERLRLSAEIRCENADVGTIWMRIDGRDRRGLNFDNMLERTDNGALRGSVGWTDRSVVLDVAEDAASIHYGFFLQGHGRVWARRFTLESALPNETTTAPAAKPAAQRSLPERPLNLDFAR